jgi:cytoskeletal protein CcmA (bactofilin family)
MNWTSALGTWNLLGLSSLLILAPFYPAWREWRFPSDTSSTPNFALNQKRSALLHVAKTTRPDTSIPSTNEPPLRLSPDAVVSGTVQSASAIITPCGSCFETLIAPAIFFGQAVQLQSVSLPLVAQTLITTLPQASRWGHNGWHIEGDCHIQAAHHVRGPLVVTGQLRIDEDCVIEGDIKARAGLQIGERTLITGAVFSDRDIHLAANVHVGGPVMAEGTLLMDSGAEIGDIDTPTTLSARYLAVRAGAISHGAVHATSIGVVL